ncbi:MAG: hypothetical protein QXK12_03005 [Candidatus Nezhaarchaeales archaeon]
MEEVLTRRGLREVKDMVDKALEEADKHGGKYKPCSLGKKPIYEVYVRAQSRQRFLKLIDLPEPQSSIRDIISCLTRIGNEQPFTNGGPGGI